jgi:Phosphoinositide phospholipase C, Ca2+-dependent
LSLAVVGFTPSALAPPNPAGDPQINQIQVIGTHNSYQLPPDPRVMAMMGPALSAAFKQANAHLNAEQSAALAEEHPWGITDPSQTLDYIQMPLEMQLRMGVRSLEFDLQPDPAGGLYADPLPYQRLRKAGETNLAPINEAELRQPGMKVFHLADLDFRSQCPRLLQCLTLLRQWSDANPGHSPVFILLEPKLSGLNKSIPGATEIPPFGADAFAEVDASLRSVIGADRLFTPDQLRGTHATLEQAARARAWPRLSQVRGKFIFLYLVPGLNFAAFQPYLAGHESLQGRAAFVQGLPGMAHTAFVLVDNATARPGRVEGLVAQGYLVRSRADIDTGEARRNITQRRDRTLASGAQIISTDYLAAPNIYGNSYHVSLLAQGWRDTRGLKHRTR